MSCTGPSEAKSQMHELRCVLRGIQQAKTHTQEWEPVVGPGEATTRVPLLDCAPQQVYRGAFGFMLLGRVNEVTFIGFVHYGVTQAHLVCF